MHFIDIGKRRWHVKDAVEGWKEEDGEADDGAAAEEAEEGGTVVAADDAEGER